MLGVGAPSLGGAAGPAAWAACCPARSLSASPTRPHEGPSSPSLGSRGSSPEERSLCRSGPGPHCAPSCLDVAAHPVPSSPRVSVSGTWALGVPGGITPQARSPSTAHGGLLRALTAPQSSAFPAEGLAHHQLQVAGGCGGTGGHRTRLCWASWAPRSPGEGRLVRTGRRRLGCSPRVKGQAGAQVLGRGADSRAGAHGEAEAGLAPAPCSLPLGGLAPSHGLTHSGGPMLVDPGLWAMCPPPQPLWASACRTWAERGAWPCWTPAARMASVLRDMPARGRRGFHLAVLGELSSRVPLRLPCPSTLSWWENLA